jgi:hypothetical protein
MWTNSMRRRVVARGSEPALDASGYAVFSAGDAGDAHVRAHRALDAGRHELGRRLLGAWLDRRSRVGAGSEWVHLQFHMAIFELAADDWKAAYTRFMSEILPAATTTEFALTDGPGLLWRLALTAMRPVELPWAQLRRTALRCMQRPSEPFVELHHLLALAGAGDVESLDRWLERRRARRGSPPDSSVEQAAAALRACAAGSYHRAAILLQTVAPELPRVGGSRAQNQLFTQIGLWCRRRAKLANPRRSYPFYPLAA